MPTPVDVSVVVATRNRATILPAALRSLSAQRCAASFEVVVVDNGSEDTTGDVIRTLARTDPRIRTVAELAIGLSHAKNAGIRAARGRLILFTDDDVVIDEDWIAAYVDFFDRVDGSTSVVAGGPVLPIPHDLSEWPAWVSPAARTDLPSLFYGAGERPLRASEWLWGANMAAPKVLLESLEGFRTDLGRGAQAATFEDVDLVDRLRALGGEAWYCPAARVRHRVDSSAARPRQLLLTAFNRGCNDRVATRHGQHPEIPVHVHRGRLAAGLALPFVLATFAASAAGFRLTGRSQLLDLARRSAWGAGWCMWAIVEESSRRRARIVRSTVLGVRRIALRITRA